MQPFRSSLFLRLFLGMILVSILAIAAATAFLYVRFGNADTKFREGTLRTFARALIHAVQDQQVSNRLVIPSYVTDDIRTSRGRFAVVTADGAVLDGSPGLNAPLAPIGRRPREYFSLEVAGRQQFGLSAQVPNVTPRLWAQVEFSENSIVFDSVLEEFVRDIAWIWIPFILLILVVNGAIARVALRPLSLSAQHAERIGPGSVSIRLPESGLPGDVLVLVQAINRALDRLQDGFRQQENFVSDAAHELRTPLAVIRAQLSAAEGPLVEVLRRDVATMERLVDQLLDRARLGGMHVEPQDRADLSAIAHEVAEYMAPLILARGRTIEVLGAEHPVWINGVRDFLFRALRNLVENAVDHTPLGTAVVVVVRDEPAVDVIDRGPGVPAEQRQNVVTRFWQGRRDRSQGAGIGLSIVQQTVTGHRGSLKIGEAEEGGAIFSMIFPSLADPCGVRSA